MTFSLQQGGLVMSSQITHTHTIINIVIDSQKWPRDTHSVTYVPGLSTLLIFRASTRGLHRYSSVAQDHLHTIHPNLGLSCTHPPLNSAINTLLAIWYSSILSTCLNHLSTLWSAVLTNSHSIPALLRTLHS